MASRWLAAVAVAMTMFLLVPGTFLFPNRNRSTTLGVAMTDFAMVSVGTLVLPAAVVAV